MHILFRPSSYNTTRKTIQSDPPKNKLVFKSIRPKFKQNI